MLLLKVWRHWRFSTVVSDAHRGRAVKVIFPSLYLYVWRHYNTLHIRVQDDRTFIWYHLLTSYHLDEQEEKMGDLLVEENMSLSSMTSRPRVSNRFVYFLRHISVFSKLNFFLLLCKTLENVCNSINKINNKICWITGRRWNDFVIFCQYRDLAILNLFINTSLFL